MFAARILFGEREPSAVIENVAVLKDFNEGRAFVRGGVLERVLQVRLEDVHGTSVKRGDPNFQFGVGDFDTGGDGGSAAMDCVESVSVHVVGETAGAADARDDDEIFLANAELRENGLHGGEDGGVVAAGAPAHFLVGLKVFFCQRWWKSRGAHRWFPCIPSIS